MALERLLVHAEPATSAGWASTVSSHLEPAL
jgi:hypothetical protein